MCGGVQEDTWEYFCQFDALRPSPSGKTTPPASRPLTGSGRVGAAAGGSILILKSWSMPAGEAKVYAELGYAFRSDGSDMTIPPARDAACMEEAPTTRGSQPIRLITSMPTRPPLWGRRGGQAIARAGNLIQPTKSMTGHETGAVSSNETSIRSL
jgi:3-oxoacyl-(acyl-carrier-protein) synthase